MNIAQTPDKLFGALNRERCFMDRMAFTNLMAVVELFRSLIASLHIKCHEAANQSKINPQDPKSSYSFKKY